MLSRKKKTRAWFTRKSDSLNMLAALSEIWAENQPCDTSWQRVGTLLIEHVHVAAAGIYTAADVRAAEKARRFVLKGFEGEQLLFDGQTAVTARDFEICGITLSELGTVFLPDLAWNQIAEDCFLHQWHEQQIQTLLHIPLITHGDIYGSILLGSRSAHHVSREDAAVFSVLARHVGLAVERVLLTERFEQEVAANLMQLHESEDKYRVVFEDAGEAIVMVDIDTQCFLEANRQAELLSGYSRDELLGMRVGDFWVTKAKHGMSENLLRIVARRHSVTLRERKIRRKDGQRVWVALTASTVTYHGKEVILSIIRNISQRKQLELERRVIETVNQALISSHDVRDVYNTVCRNVRAMFAFDWMDILLPGKSADSLRLFLSINITNNESNLEEREYLHEAPFLKGIFTQGAPEIVVYAADDDGRSLPDMLERDLCASLFFPLEYQGHVTGIVHFGSYRPDTFSPQHFDFLKRIASQLAIAIENTQLFRAISEERAVYKHLIENVNELVFQVNPRGTIMFVNHRVQHVLGRTPDEIIGTSFFSYVFPEDLENARAAFRLVMRHEQPFSGEYRVIHKNRSVLTISIYTRPIMEDGRAVGMQGIIQDITPPAAGLTSQRSGLHDLIGRSSRMQEIYDLIANVAETDSTVLIHGESGTGKELIAHAVHRSSHRSHQPFIVVNCAAYSENLLESELFGHERGAFTGAHRRKLGRFELAQGGTIFLDEIGEIPLHSQLLLLRVLQNKTFERVGGEKTLNTDARVVAATNRKLVEEMKAGRFREDLYYRLNVISIEVPPLRDRKDDIPALVEHFLKKYAAATGRKILQCSKSALELFVEHDWYGNVRELENAIERAVVMASGSMITPGDLPADLQQRVPVSMVDEYPADAQLTLYEHEKRLITRTLKAVKWNKNQAAKQLGITRTTLYSKIQKYHIQERRKK